MMQEWKLTFQIKKNNWRNHCEDFSRAQPRRRVPTQIIKTDDSLGPIGSSTFDYFWSFSMVPSTPSTSTFQVTSPILLELENDILKLLEHKKFWLGKATISKDSRFLVAEKNQFKAFILLSTY